MTWQRVEIPMPRAESNGPGVLLLTERELRFLTMRCVWQLSTKEVAARVFRSENGRLLLIARTQVDGGAIWQSFSDDDGATWATWQATNITDGYASPVGAQSCRYDLAAVLANTHKVTLARGMVTVTADVP